MRRRPQVQKACAVCHETFALRHFRQRSTQADGRADFCRGCNFDFLQATVQSEQ